MAMPRQLRQLEKRNNIILKNFTRCLMCLLSVTVLNIPLRFYKCKDSFEFITRVSVNRVTTFHSNGYEMNKVFKWLFQSLFCS